MDRQSLLCDDVDGRVNIFLTNIEHCCLFALAMVEAIDLPSTFFPSLGTGNILLGA